MKINPTFALFFLWLLLLAGAGTLSARIGFTLAQDAIKGVSQPSQNLKNSEKTNPVSQRVTPSDLQFVDEKALLTEVQNYISNQSKELQNSAADKSDPEQNSSKLLQEQSLDPQKFPLKAEQQGVTLEVVQVVAQGGSLLLNVNLTNQGAKAVQFLYSFLEIRDNNGKAISAITDDLPEELPANGNRFSGSVRIPLALLSNVKYISLNLTDYPEQDIILKIPEIPVKTNI